MKSMVNLNHNEVPTQWYNIIPDLPEPLPPPRTLKPDTQEPESSEPAW
jgi:tryptophan synthase beta chain